MNTVPISDADYRKRAVAIPANWPFPTYMGKPIPKPKRQPRTTPAGDPAPY